MNDIEYNSQNEERTVPCPRCRQECNRKVVKNFAVVGIKDFVEDDREVDDFQIIIGIINELINEVKSSVEIGRIVEKEIIKKEW